MRTRKIYNKKYLLILGFTMGVFMFLMPSTTYGSNVKISKDSTRTFDFEKPKKNLIKLQTLSLFYNNLSGSVQRYLGRRHSIELTVFGSGIWKDREYDTKSGVGGEMAFRYDISQKNGRSKTNQRTSQIFFWQLVGGGRSISEASLEINPDNSQLRKLNNREYGFGGADIGMAYFNGNFYIESSVGALVLKGQFKALEIIDEVVTDVSDNIFNDGPLYGNQNFAGRLAVKIGLLF